MRKPDKIIVIKGEKLPVFNSPFTEEDYNNIISFRHTYDKFGITDNRTGTFKIYDFEKVHIPNVNYLWNLDFNFLNSIKIMGLAVAGWYAYRLASYKPSLSTFQTSADEFEEKKKSMKDIFPLANPKIVYNGNGKGFAVEEE